MTKRKFSSQRFWRLIGNLFVAVMVILFITGIWQGKREFINFAVIMLALEFIGAGLFIYLFPEIKKGKNTNEDH